MMRYHDISVGDLDCAIEQLQLRYSELAFYPRQIHAAHLSQALEQAYNTVGLGPPRLLVTDSPEAGMEAISEHAATSQLTVCAPVIERFGQQFWKQFDHALRLHLPASILNRIRALLMMQPGRQIGQMSALLGGHLGTREDWCGDFLWGSQDLHRIAVGKMAKEIGVPFSRTMLRALGILGQIGSQCEWWWPFHDIVVVSQRPAAMKWDSEQRLHCDDGPAIQYADGLELFAWHGVGVPRHWILDRANIDPVEVIEHPNIDARAAGASIAGMAKMFAILDHHVIDDSGSDDIGQLIELKLPGHPNAGRFLKAICPRNGTIVEGIPRFSDIDGLPIDTAIAAQAWRIGDRQSEYRHPPRRT